MPHSLFGSISACKAHMMILQKIQSTSSATQDKNSKGQNLLPHQKLFDLEQEQHHGILAPKKEVHILEYLPEEEP